jgi:hypothetical protein
MDQRRRRVGQQAALDGGQMLLRQSEDDGDRL